MKKKINEFAQTLVFNSALDKERSNAFVTTIQTDGVYKAATFKEAVKIGLVPMTGGDTPGGLYFTAIQDAQEKLLAYFLTGGTADNMDEKLTEIIQDEDFIVVIGISLDYRIVSAFAVNRYERNTNVYEFVHFNNEWAIPPVVDAVFANAKLVDTL